MQSNPIEVAPWGDRLTKNKSASPNRLAAVLTALWQFCRRKPLGALGGFIVLGLLIMAVFAPWIAPYQYDETIPGARMKAPGAQFWMGTDNLGRDVYSRVVYGAAVSVTVGFGAVLLANVLATVIGITSGYFGGAYDICVQRVVDAWQSFPFLVVILSLMAVLGPGLLNLVLALGVLGAAAASRVIRGTTISVMQNTYVEAARALGAGHLRIMLRYILPNVAATVIILATIGLGARHPRRVGAVVPGLRRAAPLPVLGRHALRLRPLVHVPRAVDGHLAGRGHLARRLRLQHAGRRAPRRARSAAARRRRAAGQLEATGQRRIAAAPVAALTAPHPALSPEGRGG